MGVLQNCRFAARPTKSASWRAKSTLRVGEIADAMISVCGRMADLISFACKADGFHPSASEDLTMSKANDIISS